MSLIDQSIQLSVNVKVPVIQNQKVDVQGSSVLLINAGDETITIDRGLTIPVGQAITMKTGDDLNVVFWNLSVSFAGGGVNPRLEIVEMRIDEPGFGNYKYK